jgi:hypothetical protein
MIVAAADLKVVKLMRAAMGTGGCRATPLGPAPTFRGDCFEPRRRIEPTPFIQPRRVIQPTPRFEPRFTIHPRPNFEQRPLVAPLEPEMPSRICSPIQPPWTPRLWPTTPQPAPQVKRIVQQPDIVSKGLLLDMFL